MEKAYKVTDYSWYYAFWSISLKFNFAKSKSIFTPILLITWKEHTCFRSNLLLISIFSVSPRFASSFRKLAPPSVSTSLKVIQKTYCTQSTRMNHGKNSRTTSNQPGLFQLLQCLPWQCLPWRKAGQPLVVRGSDAGAPEPRRQRGQGTLGRRDGHGSSSMPSITHPSWRLQTVPCCSYLPLPELVHFNSANTQCVLWILAKISWSCTAIYNTDIFLIFFPCFLVHTEIMKYNLYTRSILQFAYHEAVSHTYLKKNVC